MAAKNSRRLASSAVWLQEQVDDPPESQCHEKGQKENDSSTKLVVPGVGSGGEQAHKDVQPDGLDQVQPIDVECGTDKPAPEDHRHESSEEDVDDDKEEVAGDVTSLSSGVVAHGEPLSSSERNCSCFTKNTALAPGWRLSKMRFQSAIYLPTCADTTK